MRHSTGSITAPHKAAMLCLTAGALLALLAAASLFVGRYPLTLSGLLANEGIQRQVFWSLRLSRTVMAVCGGFCLGVTGYVFQTVFRNPLASPDLIGISSGASAGAAAGILFLGGTAAVTACAFGGALLAVGLALCLARLDRGAQNATVVLAGIAVQALAQTVLMALKRMADPEKELASIEYWIMGSLSGIGMNGLAGTLVTLAVCMAALFALHRQVVLLAAEETEARMLGVNVGRLRLAVLLTATLAVAATVSRTGLISFIGLLAPHIARLLTRQSRPAAMLLSGLSGGVLLCAADILARSVGQTELPVSIFTSLLGAPFLIWLIAHRRALW